MEHLTRWPIVWETRTQTSAVAVHFFKHDIFGQFRAPKAVLSNNRPAFMAATWGDALERHKIQRSRVAAYVPQANGRAERMICTMKHALTKILAEDKEEEWDEEVPQIERTYRTRRGKDRNSPFLLMFGRIARLGDVTVAGLPQEEEKMREEVDVNDRVVQIGAAMGPRCSRIVCPDKGEARHCIGD